MIKKFFRKYKTILLISGVLAYIIGAGILVNNVLRNSRVTDVEIIIEDSLLNNFVSSEDVKKILDGEGIVLMGKLCDTSWSAGNGNAASWHLCQLLR